MKLTLALLLPLVANGASLNIEKRQVDPKSSAGQVGAGLISALTSRMIPKKKATKIEQIPPKFSHIPGVKRMRIQYGPYKLKAANSTVKVGNGMSMDKGGTGYQYMVDDDFPSDITVLETKSEVQDEKFQRADLKDGIYNHHNVFMDLSKSPAPAFSCESGKPHGEIPVSVFMAGATEVGEMTFAATSGDVKSGYYLPKNRRMLNMIDVVNYNNVERNVYVSAEIEYLPGKAPGYLEARQERIDPGMCGGESGIAIHPPRGVQKFSVNSTGVVVARDGYMVNMRGHIHDGGLDIFLTINGKEVCDSRAQYGGEGHTGKTPDGHVWETIRVTSTCREPIKVVKGDKLYMEAHYDLGLHPSRQQGHGSMGGMRRIIDTVRSVADAGEGAEQMALFVTHFAYSS